MAMNKVGNFVDVLALIAIPIVGARLAIADIPLSITIPSVAVFISAWMAVLNDVTSNYLKHLRKKRKDLEAIISKQNKTIYAGSGIDERFRDKASRRQPIPKTLLPKSDRQRGGVSP